MGQRISKVGASGGTSLRGNIATGERTRANLDEKAYEQQEESFIREVVDAMTKPYDPENPGNNLSRSDAAAMVEAFAMTHPQANEDEIMDTIDTTVFVLKNGTTGRASRRRRR